MMHPVSLLALGFLLGLRHALDPDHVIALSTILSRNRTVRFALLSGLAWGIGHTSMILAAGILALGFGLTIPVGLENSLESFVGAMLILLGLSNVIGITRWIHRFTHGTITIHPHLHIHDRMHIHVHEHEGTDRQAHQGSMDLNNFTKSHGWWVLARPFTIGVIHGLAGSGAVVILVSASVGDIGSGMGYLGLFGLGTVIGMIMVSLTLAGTVYSPNRKFARLEPILNGMTGIISILYGVYIVASNFG
jgi:ABC-type nickel/cobalt efflux system permease component RcnA